LSQKRGRFERANKGTIFLDEIGELPLQAQVRLLKVLQSKEIERVGGVKTISLDIRIIAATNRNLEEMVKLRQFREDLWFRLNVFPIWIPPLRERRSDIPVLLQHFISLKSRELKLPAIPLSNETANLDEMISQHISWVLTKTNGKIHGPGGAAGLLGINASTLRNRMNKLGIKYGKAKK
jgi:transcriptional regulator with GAF, ATPase, and Fis domain